MKVEVLVSTMNKNDLSIADKMNISGDAIIINQCDHFGYIDSNLNNRSLKMYSFAERGVGKSRNSALMRSDADICLMADDDMVYVDNYEEIVINAFKENPLADMIMFNVPIVNKNGDKNIKIKKNERIRFFNSLKYGTVNIAFKRERILKGNIFFSLLFGGGAKYSCGEDTLFITESLKKGLRIHSNTTVIATIEEGESSWFTGYNEKYFYDRGVLFAAISKKIAILLALQFVYRKKHMFNHSIPPKKALSFMLKGIKEYTKNTISLLPRNSSS